MSIPFDIKEQIRQAIDIVDLVGSYHSLQRQGRIYKMLCPWHDDHSPSMQVNPERQSYKCWVCGEGGDIFAFMMKSHNVAFPEALAMLADRAGIELKPQHHPPSGSVKAEDPKKLMIRAMAWAEQEYHRCLLDASEAEPARKYLAERGISPESIERFRLGYAPDQWEWLNKRLNGQPFRSDVLEQVGLVVRRPEGNGRYDRFKGRVLFPIHDPLGQSIALGGRLLPSAQSTHPAKYVNSPESPLFSKSQVLYGLDLARAAIGRRRTAIVMEGYTDCIIAQQFGVENAVAVLGTALTERHLQLLKRCATGIRVILVLDGDAAGRRRANDLLQMFLAQQVDLRVLTLPGELDPCDFLLQRGADAFQALLEQAPDALEHKFQTVTTAVSGQNGTFAVTAAAEDVLTTLAQAPRLREGGSSAMRLKEEQILNRLAHRFAMSETTLRERLTELRRGTRRPEPVAPQIAVASLPVADWERALLSIVLRQPELLSAIRGRIGPEQLTEGVMRDLFVKCCDLADEEIQPTFDRLLTESDEPAIKRLLVELDERGEETPLDEKTLLESLFVGVERRQDRNLSRRARTAMEQQSTDAGEQLAVLQRFAAQKRNRSAARESGMTSTNQIPAAEPGGGLRSVGHSDQNEG